MIRRPHGHADVSQLFVNLLLRAGLQLVLVGQPAVGRSEIQIEVAAHRSAQPLTAIQQEHLRPQILQTVGRGRAGQPHHAGKLSQHFLQRQKALRPAVLEGRKLVDHQHIEGHLSSGVVFDQPFHVFPVDHVQFRFSGQRGDALFGCSENTFHPQPLQVLPLGQFADPGIPRYSKRGNNQNAAHLVAVIQQMRDGRERNNGFPEAAVQK